MSHNDPMIIVINSNKERLNSEAIVGSITSTCDGRGVIDHRAVHGIGLEALFMQWCRRFRARRRSEQRKSWQK
jgi:hypothetical protein